MLVTVKFMLLNVGCEEAGHHSFSHLNISVLKNFPFRLPSDDRILVILLMMDLSCCFLAVCKAFWNIHGRFKRRFKHTICYYAVNC